MKKWAVNWCYGMQQLDLFKLSILYYMNMHAECSGLSEIGNAIFLFVIFRNKDITKSE